MSAQFTAGDCGEEGGVRWRVLEGKKQARVGRDLVFEISIGRSEWVPVKMSLVAAAIILLYENEDRLYPPEMGYAGRKKLAWYLRDSLNDWKAATARLEMERVIAAERREAA